MDLVIPVNPCLVWLGFTWQLTAHCLLPSWTLPVVTGAWETLVGKSEAMQTLSASALAVIAVPIHRVTLFLFSLLSLQKLFLLPLKSLKSIYSEYFSCYPELLGNVSELLLWRLSICFHCLYVVWWEEVLFEILRGFWVISKCNRWFTCFPWRNLPGVYV